jgi:hypothetical protein
VPNDVTAAAARSLLLPANLLFFAANLNEVAETPANQAAFGPKPVLDDPAAYLRLPRQRRGRQRRQDGEALTKFHQARRDETGGIGRRGDADLFAANPADARLVTRIGAVGNL